MNLEQKRSHSAKRNVFSLTNVFLPRVQAAGLFGKDADEVDEKYKDLFKSSPGESGWDRLKSMFVADEYGKRSPEMNNVLIASLTATFAGAVGGGFIGSQLAAREAVERFKVLQFSNDVERQNRLAVEMRSAFLRKGLYWSWRIGLFTGTYLFIVTTVSVYRNKSSLLEYVMAGGAVGTMVKFNAGPKLACTGGLVGSAVGAVAGGISVGLMWLTGSTLQERRYWQNYHLRNHREIKGTEAAGTPPKNTNMERPADLTTEAFPPI